MKRIYLIAMIMAVITAYAVYNFAEALENSSKVKTVSVVTAAETIPENTALTDEMLTVKQLPAEAVSEQAVKNIGDIRGCVAKEPLAKDEQILSSMVSRQGSADGGLAYTVPNGKRAITLQVDEFSGIAGNIAKGNRVDVAATVTTQSTTPHGTDSIPESIIAAENIEVLATGMNNTRTDDKGSNYTSVTLAVTPDEAVRLNYASTEGKLRLLLRPVLDNKADNAAPYTPY